MIEVVNWIIGRGKNRDIYGNPYYAAVVFTNRRKIIVPMSYTNDSSEEGVLKNVLNALVDRKIRVSTSRVMYHYSKASKDSQLEHPERWVIEGGARGMITVKMHEIPIVPKQVWHNNLRTYKIKRF